MSGTANQATARVPGPQGTSPGQSNVQVQASGTMPLARPNGLAQTLGADEAIEHYLQNLLVWRPFLGIRVQVHKTLAASLADVETSLNYPTNQSNHGIATIRGKQPQGHGIHSFGCAIDLNYETSPYLMHEAGEKALDATLPDVYNRIAYFVLGRASVIPLDITIFNASVAHRDAMYTALKEESDAMRKYFGLFMRDPGTYLGPYLASAAGAGNARKTSWNGGKTGTVPTTVDALKQIQADWVTLTGRSNGPQILLLSSPGGSYSTWQNPCDVGMCYPQAVSYPVEAGHKTAPDAPFVSKSGVVRDPSNGFMNFDHDVVKALCDHGFTWGAISFGAESGDVMHFELTNLGAQVKADLRRALPGAI
jgi:hypothetical protein